jgi:pimeloyl-ACP methyl ester carboxylesterase
MAFELPIRTTCRPRNACAFGSLQRLESAETMTHHQMQRTCAARLLLAAILVMPLAVSAATNGPQKPSGLMRHSVLGAGVGRNWIEYELANLRRQLELDGQAPERVDAMMHIKEECMHRLLVAKEAELDIESGEPACKEMNTYPAPASYLQQAAAMNEAEPWIKLRLPVLAIYGTADFITTQADHQRIVDMVNANRPGLAILTLIPGMDHHLDAAGTPQQAYDLRIKQHGMAPYEAEFSKAVLDWLCRHEQCSG